MDIKEKSTKNTYALSDEEKSFLRKSLNSSHKQVHRAADLSSFSSSQPTILDNLPIYAKPTQEKVPSAKPCTPTLDVPNTPWVCPLEAKNAGQLITTLEDYFSRTETLQNFHSDKANQKILGWAFGETYCALFSVQVYFQKGCENLSVACECKEGYPPLVSEMWIGVKKLLHEMKLYVQDDPVLYDDIDFDESDTEFSDEDFESFKYMEYGADTGILKDLLDSLKHPKHQLSTLLSLAWNIQSQNNLETIKSHGYDQQFFDFVVATLEFENKLPIVRACCILVASLACSATMTSAQVAVLAHAMQNWWNGATAGPVKQSPEIAELLSRGLKQSASKVKAKKQELQKIQSCVNQWLACVPHDNIKRNLAEFIAL